MKQKIKKKEVKGIVILGCHYFASEATLPSVCTNSRTPTTTGVVDYAINEKSLELVFVRLSHITASSTQHESGDCAEKLYTPHPPIAWTDGDDRELE